MVMFLSRIAVNHSLIHIPRCFKSTTFANQHVKHKIFKRLSWCLFGGSIVVGTYSGYLIFDEKVPSSNILIQDSLYFYNHLPLNFLSRFTGFLSQVNIPDVLKDPIYGTYAKVYQCKLDEALNPNLKDYTNFSEFFRRQIKLELRPINNQHCLTSPADGRILYQGRVTDGRLEQVKGVDYSLQDFLGIPSWKPPHPLQKADTTRSPNDASYEAAVKQKSSGTHLFFCTIYLAPGDYHRFHSPADWSIQMRRHFPGKLLSVSPCMAFRIPSLFTANERACYYGKWVHGFFSYTAVGATNVGSMAVFCDPGLQTNVSRRWRFPFIDKSSSSSSAHSWNDEPLSGVQCNKGEMFGEFNLGSTIVLIFEAPESFKFTVQSGERILVGQALGNVYHHT